MSDLRDRLERLSDRAAVAPDAFERLERARRSRERNRRIAAGTVALLLAVAGTVAAFTAFRQPAGRGPAAGGTGATAPMASSPVAEFTCDANGAIAPRSLSVHAQPDGVHVAVTNLANEHISFTVGGSESTLHVVDQGGADPGERKEIVVGVPPGGARVSCRLTSAGGIDTSPMADLHVVDPAGSFVPIGMTCPMTSQATDDAMGFQGDPVEIARDHLSGLEFDDSVERAGYPSGDQPLVRVVRNGDVVAIATFGQEGQGSWRVDTLVTCVNVPIGYSQEAAGVSGSNGSPIPPNAWDHLCATARSDGPNTDHNGADLTIEGSDLRFDTRCLIAPAGQQITIRLSNGDADVLRNISIYRLTSYLRECIVTGTAPSKDIDHPVFEAGFVEGAGQTRYEVGPLEPGEYYFQDDIHPTANGVLVVE